MKIARIAALVLTITSIWLVAFAAAPAVAQEFPKGPVRLIVPFPPGGPTDVIARLMSQKLQALWSQPVVVDYKPGAGTVIGTDAVAKSAPDGRTIGVVVSSYTINPVLHRAMPYDTLKDLVGVTRLVNIPLVLVAHPDAPFDDLKGLVAYAKRNPGKLSYGSPGAGGTAHLAGELLNDAAGIDLVHVPYKGSAPAQTDVLGGRVPLMIDPLFSALPYVRAGRMKVIAVTTERRVAGFEQYPTVAETYPGFDVSSLLGFVVPAATPRAIVAKIYTDSLKAVNLPEVRSRIMELGNEVIGSTPEEFDAFVAAEIKRWTRVITEKGIRAE
ncbi:MAG TPA: tripartite tricarboxylate transporter substrate binding protein [Burkholderiales bacterium]